MDLILDLIKDANTASTLMFLALVGLFGIMLGKVKILNVKLGIAGVLFAGLLAGHLGAKIDHHVLHFVKEFGLILFVYSIGIEIGPRFLSSFKHNGLKLNIFAAAIVLLGFGTAVLVKYVFDLPVEVIAGLLSGAVTNTPSLGAVQSLVTEQFKNGDILAQTSGMAYAVAYPFGIIGILLSMMLVRVLFGIKVSKEVEDYKEASAALSGRVITVQAEVSNPNIEGKSLEFVKQIIDKEFVLSRVLRDGKYMAPEDSLIIKKGDSLIGLCPKDNFDTLAMKIGKVQPKEKLEMEGQLSMRHIVITNRKIAGHTIKDIHLSSLYPANITRVFRGDTEIIPNENTLLHFGDLVRVVGVRAKMDTVANFLGNSQRDLSAPNLVPLFIGVLLGIVLGSIPMAVPGLPAPARLGLAGGPLIIALILGHKGRFGKLDFYMTPSANHFIRELGIVLFLACVGLGAGKNFVSTITNGGYMWMLYAAIITAAPLIIVGSIARIFKTNYLTITGTLAGSMTDPPALEFSNAIAPTQAQSSAYATVYPLTMFLRILMAQVLVLMFV